MIEKNKSIETLVNTKFGDGILVGGNAIIDEKQSIIPISPSLNLILGGGVPEGSLFIITGPPKAGKTSLCIHFAGIAQNPIFDSTFGPRHIYYFNIEGRIKSRDLLGIKHLNVSKDKFTVIRSIPCRILTAENYIDIGEKLINEKHGCIFIFDSFSALCTEGEYAANIGDRYRADSPQLLAKFCRRISNVIPINKSIVMGITHIIANQGQGMSIWTEASGRKLQYQVDVKLKATHFKPWIINDTQIGQDIYWECITSALGPPGGKCTSKFRYNYGLDKEMELANLCVDLGIVKKGGSWYTIGDEKVQGIENVRNVFLNNTKLYTDLYTQIMTMMNLNHESV